MRLTALQAAWRLSEGWPADEEVAVAKFWAGDGGMRAMHACQHLHGGLGVDLEYPLHRYFLWCKQIEHELGTPTRQLLELGAHLAATPVVEEHDVDYNLADIFESLVDVIGDREALVCGDRRLTYAELEARANRLAHYLLSIGIAPGDHVGVQLYNCTEYVETMIACFKVRAVPVNVNYRYVEDELLYLYNDADLVALVHDTEFTPRVDAVRAEAPLLRELIAVGDGELPDGAVRFDDAIAAQPRPAASARARPTTSTSSTPAARPACRRV